MDLENIQNQLNTLFAKQDTRIVFWFDDKGDYEGEVSELELGSVKLHVLDGTNWLYSKWLLNESDKDGRYLVYAPFPKPSDWENPLADMCYYSIQYYTDRISQMLQELEIDSRFKEHFAQYGDFWKDKNRIEKFKELGIDHFNVETIDIGLIAVVTDVKKPNFEEIVKQLLFNDSDKYMKNIDYNGLTICFWNLCKKYFGYTSQNPNINDLAASMIVTYAVVSLKNTLPASFKEYILAKKNDVMVFVRNAMDNINCQESYDKLSVKVDKELRVTARIKAEYDKDSRHLDNIFACDAFASMDNIIIDWIVDKLDSEILDSQIDGCNIAQIADQRMSKSYHFGKNFEYEYKALKYAYMMMKSVSLMEYTSDIKSLVENIYSNTYLQKLTPKWMQGVIKRLQKTRCLMPAKKPLMKFTI
jgi:hypothetical protein